MADQKITQLTEATTVADNVPLPFAEDPTGSPVTKKVKAKNLLRQSATLTVASSATVGGADYYCDATADDVQIQAALDALPAGGGRVVLREGVFNIAAAVTMTKSNVILEGQGSSTQIKLTDATNTDCIQLGDGTNAYSHITVRNLEIDGNMANQTTQGHGIQVRRKAAYYTIDNCFIENTYKANIYDDNRDADGSIYGVIKNNYLDTTKVGGAWSNIEGVGNAVLIDGNTCIGGDYANISVYWAASYGPVIVNNRCLSSGGRGIDLSVALDAMVASNYIYNATKASIYVVSTYHTIITGNTIIVKNNPTGSNIIDVLSQNSIINGNKIRVDTGNTAALTGINLAGSNYVVNNNNILFKTSQSHIGITTGTSQMSLTGNVLINNSGPVSADIGIKTGGASDMAISGNFITGFSTGIDTTNSAIDVTITGNNLWNNTSGILINLSQGMSITGNAIEGGTNAILSTSDSYTKYCSITGNTIYSCTGSAIILRSCKFCIVSSNTIRGCTGGTATIFIETVSGTNYSTYNTINGNTLDNSGPTYNIRENSTNDGPNIITSNIALNAGTQISTQNGSSVSANNITT